jgi:iron complex transport system ATP-binding protein
MTIPLLAIKDLSWQVNHHHILKNINCSIPQGQVIGVIGPNGAGKSSLLRCLYRVTKPCSGGVFYQGTNIWQIPAKQYARTMAVVLQETPHNFSMSVSQVIAMGLTPHKGLFSFDSASDNAIIVDAISRVGLIDHAEQPFDSLSGGEKQRALIARAIVQQPQILVMDEPTNHLDVKYQIQILELVRSLGITVVVSIHDLNLASAMCDNLLVLNHGEVVHSGAPEEVITSKLLSEVFGICCTVQPHPQNQKPNICYYYGYQQDSDVEREHSND